MKFIATMEYKKVHCVQSNYEVLNVVIYSNRCIGKYKFIIFNQAKRTEINHLCTDSNLISLESLA